jgi:hypothetical protein
VSVAATYCPVFDCVAQRVAELDVLLRCQRLLFGRAACAGLMCLMCAMLHCWLRFCVFRYHNWSSHPMRWLAGVMRPGPARPLVFMLRALLSLLRSFAHVAALSPEPYTRPELVEPTPGADREQSAPPDGGGGEAAEQELLPGCDLVIRRARHPCVELQDGVSFIPNDYTCVFWSQSREG